MTEMKASENPVSLHVFVSVCINLTWPDCYFFVLWAPTKRKNSGLATRDYVCISIHAHVYINSYIHELLIVLMLTEKASWF